MILIELMPFQQLFFQLLNKKKMDPLSLPLEVRAKIAELDLELSEGILIILFKLFICNLL